MRKLTLYSRQECHLCEDMFEQLQELQSELDFSLNVRDIDSNSEWYQLYNTLVPVLKDGDAEVCRYYLDMVALEKVLD